VILPAMGMASDILSTLSAEADFQLSHDGLLDDFDRRAELHRVGPSMFVSGMSPFLGSVFTLTTADRRALGRKNIQLVGNGMGCPHPIHCGRPVCDWIRVSVVSGGLSGIFLGTSAADIQLQDTYFVVAHFHSRMAIARYSPLSRPVFWFPKMFGRFMNETLGKFTSGQFHWRVLRVFPMHIIGIGARCAVCTIDSLRVLKPQQPLNVFHFDLGFPASRRPVDFPWRISSAAFSVERRRPKKPMAMQTRLEWTVPSPTGHGNFGDELPPFIAGLLITAFRALR